VFPFQLVLTMLSGWLQRPQEDVIAFLREENRVVKARLKGQRLRLDDDERRRLALAFSNDRSNPGTSIQ
jgi:hypothetical protein